MSVQSVLRHGAALTRRLTAPQCLNICQKRMGGHGPKNMEIRPSRWQYEKFKDMLHFYTMLGVIPLSLLTLCVNLMVGSASLKPIPEGYIPNDWEFHQHPITRWIVKYRYRNYQEMYEKQMHVFYVEEEKRVMRLIEWKIRDVIRNRDDVQGYAYRPVMTKYHKHIREEFETMKDTFGDNNG